MTLAIPSRRRFLLGVSAFLSAPAIVRVASIMPVSVMPAISTFGGFDVRYPEPNWWRQVLTDNQGWTVVCHHDIALDICDDFRSSVRERFLPTTLDAA